MRPKRKYQMMLAGILTVVFFFGSGILTMSLAKKNNPLYKTNNERIAKNIQITGRIDRIASDSIIISDTWFGLSGDVTTSGFKVGDMVEVIADSKYTLIRLQLKKETMNKE